MSYDIITRLISIIQNRNHWSRFHVAVNCVQPTHQANSVHGYNAYSYNMPTRCSRRLLLTWFWHVSRMGNKRSQAKMLLSPSIERSEQWRRLWDWSFCVSVCPSVCLFVFTMMQPAGTVAPSCEYFYIGGDMHSHERLLVLFYQWSMFKGFDGYNFKKNLWKTHLNARLVSNSKLKSVTCCMGSHMLIWNKRFNHVCAAFKPT